MRNTFRAEWHKLTGHRWLTGFLVWIFPMGAIGSMLMLTLLAAISDNPVQQLSLENLEWRSQMIGAWRIPANLFGRVLPLAFAAAVFAGETEWATWKNIAIRGRRSRLILMKFFIIVLMYMIAFALTSLVAGVLGALIAGVANISYGPAPNGEILGGFLSDYFPAILLAFSSIAIASGYASLAAVYTRSILAGFMVSAGASILELFVLPILIFFGNFIGVPELAHLYRFMPAYNLDNVDTWINRGQALGLPDYAGVMAADGLLTSLLILLIWVVGLVGLTIWLFKRRDITA